MYHKHYKGLIEIITGCMFAGKTEELISRINSLQYINNSKIIVFKNKIDNRFTNESFIVSHLGKKIPAVLIKNANDVYKKNIKKYNIVVFDEGNFFGSELVDVATDLANSGKRVIVAGLDTDYNGNGFSPMPELMARAEFILKLKSICFYCGSAATKTLRVSKKINTQILVGGKEIYKPCCRKHWVEKK